MQTRFNLNVHKLLIFIILFTTISLQTGLSDKEICKKNGCARTAAVFKAVMNSNVDPCTDFYTYACGKFGEYTADQHKTDERFSWTTLLTRNITEQVKEFIEGNKDMTREKNAAKKAKQFYQTCIKIEKMHEKGLEPLKNMLKSIGLTAAAPLGKAEKFNFTVVAAKMRKILNQNFLFSVKVVRDPDTPNKTIIALGKPLKSVPFWENQSTRSTLSLSAHTAEFEQYVRAIIDQMAGINDQNRNDTERRKVNKAVKSIVDFNIARQELHRQSSSNKYGNKFKTIQELQRFTQIVTKCSGEKSRTVINWKQYFETLFANVANNNEVLPHSLLDRVLLSDAGYIRKVITFLARHNNGDIKRAMWFDAATSLAHLTTNEMRTIEGNFQSIYFTTQNWNNHCYDFVKTHFGLAIIQHMVGDPEVQETKEEIKGFVNDFKVTLGTSIKDADWIDNNTKSAATEKVSKMRSRISHPSWILNDTALNHFYAPVVIVEDDFFTTVLKTKQNFALKNLLLLKTPNDVDVDDYNDLDVLEVNAYYEPELNQITIPMGILRPPFYGFPLRALNYGALGSTIGHEITHGFDNHGIAYNAAGNETEWWDAEVLANYEKRSQCFVESYNSISINGVTTDGEATLSENIADNGGLREAIMAYRYWTQKNKPETYLPGFENFTHEQLLILAYAVSWCEYLPASKTWIYEEDTHCPPQLRVLGPLINSAEFAEIWKCPKGTPMNPSKEKCRLW